MTTPATPNLLTTAMIFAAGRGERMRPLTDSCPKPLLEAGGKPLIVWQIERLAAAGVRTIVINHAWLGERIEAALGDGARWGVRLRYSAEGEALETAGGITQALPLIEAAGRAEVFVGVAGDVYADFDYRMLHRHAARLASLPAPGMHLVMVPNPAFHPDGDFALRDGMLSLDGAPRFTFGSIGVYDTRMFRDLPRGTRRALTPYYRDTIAQGRASGELYEGRWENVGTPAQLLALDRALRAGDAG
ncbi:N-acetylmuramate alpha-1-phosphate uridylyltransferase MurU [Paraburkholderia humisilvae]|uniref:N-acetylmuramate alpha-1-phosphate uridylyltransferase n=1 Tax=Paraburkholderia humisilvae TaxID=627669 RepID=A0A6J5DWS0_9BURK|nr:nucleotidyltransferase family protein [Paraburkholderia humisilvae]CAB3757944.1 N-acetylmuramate alpha-1-phosphate uridylyltransferase [Paraburkholderia humisilvae]